MNDNEKSEFEGAAPVPQVTVTRKAKQGRRLPRLSRRKGKVSKKPKPKKKPAPAPKPTKRRPKTKSKVKLGRPPRGEGTNVVGVRVSDTLHKKLVQFAKKADVPIATVLRAGGIAFAESAAKWPDDKLVLFLHEHGKPS